MLGMAKFFVLMIICPLVLSGCGWSGKRPPSILIVAVEYLGFDSFSCTTPEDSQGKPTDGFDTFCEESVRFTHAFTPSVMSQASLASIMTARYPFEHGVWHNGSQFLSAQFLTAPEVAVEKGYRTAFFSGGPPVWRKSGLSQGFEVFEDNVRPSLLVPYRPIQENVNHLTKWLEKDVGEAPFFSLFFVPDLQFPDITTVNESGEIRDRSTASQLKEVSESLGILIRNLRRLRRWDDTTIFLVGLNGRPKVSRPGELETYSLYSEATQVALYIKPARTKRDLALEWKIDKNVSLIDVGATLFDLLGAPAPSPSEQRLEVTSLRKVLERPEVTWNQDRILMVESGWPQWRGMGGSRFALRKGHYLALYDSRPKAFNTLIDRQELSPLSEKDPLFRSLQLDVLSYLQDKGFQAWTPLTSTLVEKLELGRLLWRLSKDTEEVKRRLKLLAVNRPWDRQLIGWQAQLALQEGNWEWLRELGEESGERLWWYVADINLGRPARIQNRGCDAIFLFGTESYRPPNSQECDDELLLALLKWVESSKGAQRTTLQDQFIRLYLQRKIELNIGQWNYSNALNWDVDPDVVSGPLPADLFLALPKLSNYASAVQSRLSRENERFKAGATFEF